MYLYTEHTSVYLRMYAWCNLLITAYSGSLGVPRPSLLIAVTVTMMLPLNTSSDKDGAVNVSVVFGLVTLVPL